jgi:acetyl esterase
MLHPQAEAAVALWSQGASVTDPGFGPDQIAELRALARVEAAAETREAVTAVEEIDADGVPCRLYQPRSGPDGPGGGRTRLARSSLGPPDPASGRRAARPGRDRSGDELGVVVFLHGGGFVFGDLDTHDAQARRLANRTGRAVLAVDYRRPPEHPFPAAPDDVDTALGWLRGRGSDLGLDLARTVALGDSAGGNLALVAALRNPGAFAATVLVYPFIDPRMRFGSYREQVVGGLSAAEAAWYWQQYARTPEDLAHRDLGPIDAAGLGALPATLVIAAEHDVLRDEDVELGRRIQRAGGSVTVSTYPGMVHGFWRHPELFDAAEESLAEIAAFLNRVC